MYRTPVGCERTVKVRGVFCEGLLGFTRGAIDAESASDTPSKIAN